MGPPEGPQRAIEAPRQGWEQVSIAYLERDLALLDPFASSDLQHSFIDVESRDRASRGCGHFGPVTRAAGDLQDVTSCQRDSEEILEPLQFLLPLRLLINPFVFMSALRVVVDEGGLDTHGWN